MAAAVDALETIAPVNANEAEHRHIEAHAETCGGVHLEGVELLDAALAAIHNEEAAQELIEDDIAPAEEELPTAELDDEDDDVGEDRVDSLIDGIRENAANAIAELEKPKEETPADDDKKEPEKEGGK